MAKRFSASEKIIQKALHKVMTEMGADTYEVIQEDGFRVTVIFVLTGADQKKREYRYVADFFERILDNYRAAQLAITRLWAIYNEWHIRTEDSEPSMETILKGFRVLESRQILLALPDPGDRRPWDILGIPADATEQEIEKAYRKRAKTDHPDVGGSNDQMGRLTRARDEMIEALR